MTSFQGKLFVKENLKGSLSKECSSRGVYIVDFLWNQKNFIKQRQEGKEKNLIRKNVA